MLQPPGRIDLSRVFRFLWNQCPLRRHAGTQPISQAGVLRKTPGIALHLGKYPVVPHNAYAWTFFRGWLKKRGIAPTREDRQRPLISLSGIVGGTRPVNYAKQEKGFSCMEALASLIGELLDHGDADLVLNPTVKLTQERISKLRMHLAGVLTAEQRRRVHVVGREQMRHLSFMKDLIYLSDLVVTVEGGFGHTAAGVGTPLLSLQSRTLEPELAGFDFWEPNFLPPKRFQRLRFDPHFDDLSAREFSLIADTATGMLT